MLGRTRLSAGWAVAAIVLAGASPVLAETTYATGSGSQNGAFVKASVQKITKSAATEPSGSEDRPQNKGGSHSNQLASDSHLPRIRGGETVLEPAAIDSAPLNLMSRSERQFPRTALTAHENWPTASGNLPPLARPSRAPPPRRQWG